MTEPTTETRTVYILRKAGWSRLRIPADAKVTFGPLIPGQSPDRYAQGNEKQAGYYLRVYKTKDQQLAVVPGVIEFRDSSVKLDEPDGGGFEEVTEEILNGKTALGRMEDNGKKDEPVVHTFDVGDSFGTGTLYKEEV